MSRYAPNLAFLFAMVFAATAYGEDFPQRTVTLVVPYAPGGPTDVVGRLMASEIAPVLKQQVIVVNKPGAAGTIGTTDVVRARPDGYTIGYSTAAVVGLQPLIMNSVTFKSADDYVPIIKLLEVPIALAVRDDSPYRSLQEFVADAKSRPGEISVAVAGRLTEPDIALERFQSLAGLKLKSVPYTGGSGDALVAVLGGHVQALASAVTGLPAQAQDHKIRLLGVFYSSRSSLFPDVPTTAELGYDINLPAMHFMLAPKGTGEDAIRILGDALAGAIGGSKFKELARANGFQVNPMRGEALRADIARFSGIYADLVNTLQVQRQ